MRKLAEPDELAYDRICMHEFVLSMKKLKQETGVSALDLAKGLLDKGMHPPTMYFPMIVEEALMFEPTETESRATLDAAAKSFRALIKQAHDDPQSLHDAPRTTPVRRPDEVKAARQPIIRWEA
jgi:glycine dehydrogenase subunit 2